jgi:hypothetical protein
MLQIAFAARQPLTEQQWVTVSLADFTPFQKALNRTQLVNIEFTLDHRM